MDKVFFAWQSKYPEINKSFIQAALEKAAKAVKKDNSIIVELKVDDATTDTAGAVNIHKKIFEKISQDAVFVGDVSTVNSGEPHPIPNPNVLVELGYAMGVWGTDKDKLHYIMVLNTYFGKIEDLPFDIQQLSTVTYHLSQNPSQEDKTKQFDNLVAKLTGQLRSIYSESDPFTVQNMVQQAVLSLSKPNKNERKQAIETLNGIAQNRPSAYKALLEALKHDIPDVRYEAALALLADYKEIRAVNTMISFLDDKDAQIRNEVVKTLVKFGPKIIPILHPKLVEGSLNAQCLTAMIFGEIGDQIAGPYLHERLETNPDYQFAVQLIDALGKLRYSSAINKLTECLEWPSEIPGYALKALIKIGSPAVPKLCDMLLTNSANVHGFVIRALGEIADNRAICYLLNMRLKHYDSINDNVSSFATDALQRIGAKIRFQVENGASIENSKLLYPFTEGQSFGELSLGLTLLEVDVQIAVVKAFEMMGGNLVEFPLIRVLENSPKEVRVFAIQALGRLGTDKAVQALINIVNKGKDQILINEARKALN